MFCSAIVLLGEREHYYYCAKHTHSKYKGLQDSRNAYKSVRFGTRGDPLHHGYLVTVSVDNTHS